MNQSSITTFLFKFTAKKSEKKGTLLKWCIETLQVGWKDIITDAQSFSIKESRVSGVYDTTYSNL